jgi:hypothetical protein
MPDIPDIPTSAELPEDQRLEDRLALRDLLGSGATGDVYLAHDSRLDRAVAVKLLRPRADRVARQRFDAEAHALAKLSHPGLVAIFNSGTLRGRPCLVMHFADGGTLATRLQEGPLPLATTIDIGVMLADALAHAHDHGIIHHDVKPSNILLDHDLNPRLTGFGTAPRAEEAWPTASDNADETDNADRADGADNATDSPTYRPLIGELVGPEADVHGLGLVLLECLTGQVTESTTSETVPAQAHSGSSVPATPPALARLLAEMTAPDPRRRPTAARCHLALLALRAELTDDPAAAYETLGMFAPAAWHAAAGVVPAGLATLGLTDPAPPTSLDPVKRESVTVPAHGPVPGNSRFRVRRPLVAACAAAAVAAGVTAVLLTLPDQGVQHLPTEGQHAGPIPAVGAPADPAHLNHQPTQALRNGSTVPRTLVEARVDSDPNAPGPGLSRSVAPQTTDATKPPVATTTSQPPTATPTQVATTEPPTTETSPSATSSDTRP